MKYRIEILRLMLASLVLSFLPFIASAQLGYGFKVGLNFSTITGEKETDVAGKQAETAKYVSGFQVGFGLRYNITDAFAVGTEFLFAQKGTEINYDGTGYHVFRKDNDKIIATGTDKQTIDVSNAYIDIPVLAYYKLGRVQFSGGVNVGVLATSRGRGESIFNGKTTSGSTLPEIISNLDYHYLTDAAAESIGTELTTINLDGASADIPKNLGAYYAFDSGDYSLYKRLDVGGNVGVDFFLNDALFLGARLNYGFLDVTAKNADSSRAALGADNQPILRDDKDRNISLQLSLGFSF